MNESDVHDIKSIAAKATGGGFTGDIRSLFEPNEQAHQPSLIALRFGAMTFARDLLEICPECPERTLAIRKLQEASMWAAKAVSLHGPRMG